MFAGRQNYLRGIRDATNFFNPSNLMLLSDTEVKVGRTSANLPGGNVNSAIYTAVSNRFIRGNQPFTIEFWFNQTNTTSRFPTMFSNDWNTRTGYATGDWTIQSHRDVSGQFRELSFGIGQITSATQWLFGTTALALGEWHHGAIVRTATTGCSMTGSSIDSSGVLTVGTLASGTISVGLCLTGTNVPANTVITANISGSGSGSTWQTNTTTTVGSTTITGNNFSLYVNGTREAQGATTVNLDGSNSTRRFCIGTFGTSTVSTYRGYLDELRFSTVPRYFENFTPSTEPLQNDPDTLLLLHFDGAVGTQNWTDDNT
jgi:hypothetical protein